MFAAIEWSRWVTPGAFLLGSLLAGFALERVLHGRLVRLARATAWRWDELVLEALGHAPVALIVLLGAYAATLSMRPSVVVKEIADRSVVVLLLVVLTLVAARLTGGLVAAYAGRAEGGLPASSLISNMARLVVLLLGGFLILQNLDVSITPLITGLGLGGLAVALALQPTLSNLFSGFQIIAARQVSPGQYIRLDSGEEGYVIDVQWRNTTMRALRDDHEILVPNAKLADAIVTNYNLPRKHLWATCEVGVAYDSDLERVERVTLEVAASVREAAIERAGLEPILRFHTFGESSVDFTVQIPVAEFASRAEVRHAFIKRLHARYMSEGIEIPFPMRTIELPPARGAEIG